MKDVAYFIGSYMNGDDDLRHEQQLLDYYFKELSAALSDTEMDTMEIEQEWRALSVCSC